MKKYCKVSKETYEQIAGSSLGFQNYLARLKLDYSSQLVSEHIDYCNELKFYGFTIGGSGGSKESLSFNVGRVTTINSDVQIKSKIDGQIKVNKKAIRDVLTSQFHLNGQDLNNKVNEISLLIYSGKLSKLAKLQIEKQALKNDKKALKKLIKKSSTSMRSISIYRLQILELNKKIILINKDISIYNRKIKESFYKLPNNRIASQIDFIIWLYRGYSTSHIDLNDLRQDLVLFYFENKSILFKHYRQAVKRFQSKYEVKTRFGFVKFMYRIFKRQFLEQVNSYLYAVNIPYKVKRQFTQKSHSEQKKSKVNLWKRSSGLRFSSYYIVDGLCVDGFGVKSKNFLKTKKSSDQIIGSQFYFDAVSKYNAQESQNFDINTLTKFKALKSSLTEIDRQIVDLRIDGFTLTEISEKLELTVDVIKKRSQNITKLLI